MDVVSQESDGIVISTGDGCLKLQVCDDQIIRVAYAQNHDFFTHESLCVLPLKSRPFTWEYTNPNQVTLRTAKLAALVDLKTGDVTFCDPAGNVILAEKDRQLTPATVQGAKTFHVQQEWQANPDESLYGLGENQLGLTDIRGYDLDLWQHNGTIIIPFLVSSSGYGILWDNPSFSRFGDLRPLVKIPAANLLDARGNPGALTATYFAGTDFTNPLASRTEDSVDIDTRLELNGEPINRPPTPLKALPTGEGAVRWEGSINADVTGDYSFQSFSNGDLKVWIDGKLLINHWRQNWLPWIDVAKAHMEAGHSYSIKIEWSVQQGTVARLLWKPPVPNADAPGTATSLWSEVADGSDYYFVYGPKLDDVIGGYRKLTGQAPMIPIWGLGLWQSRQRYETQQQSLDVVDGFRSRQIPFDNIVQDWFYWPENGWGSHQFDPTRFPDPAGWVKSIHEKHSRLMISVWGKFYSGTKNYQEMLARGFLYPNNIAQGLRDWVGYRYTFFDAFNPDARKLFWAQVKTALFDKGVDAWWLDATEPDLLPTPTLDGQKSHVNPTALGPGTKVLNAYSIMMGRTFYNNQRAVAPDQRVFILTRSGYAGQQRYAEASWSGDTTSTWTALHKQIAAGIGFCMSGVPYWTMDIGGFSVPARFSTRHPKPEDQQEWQELMTRWFEFGAFCPLFRVHGEFPHREMWECGGEQSEAYQTQLKYDRLRYRLLPYVYSLAGQVTRQNGTMMRGLVMDFPADHAARKITDQYMFGPAFLVSPVSTYQARTRSVYLPQGNGWYDFWSGAYLSGGQTIDATAPYDAMPLHVQAGSIIPYGPELQYTTQKPADPTTLYIYAGANGQFTIYEDDGLTYQYEKGSFSQIPITWDDASKTLTIGKRDGSFPGMLSQRTFNVLLVSPSHPVGFSFSPMIDKSAQYLGDQIKMTF